MASGNRENCRWIPPRPGRSHRWALVDYNHPKPGSSETWELPPYDHPDLLRSVRALQDYVDWVDSKLIPIVSKWIEEHREEVIDGMNEIEMNDMGAAIEKAFKLIEGSEWYKERIEIRKSFDYDAALMEGRLNPLWTRQTYQFLRGELEAKKESGLNT